MLQLPAKIHNNHQLFSDHYLDQTLPLRPDWLALTEEAEPIREQIQALFARYKPGSKEAQAEYSLVRPVLEILGHTFEVQPSLETPGNPQQPDYIFYQDKEVYNRANRRATFA